MSPANASRGWNVYDRRSLYLGLVKPAFDVTCAVIALVILSPVLALTAFLVAICFGRPILFRQLRPGIGGKPFRMLKFRTMVELRDSQGNLLADAERLTPLGRMLRKASLDELPELFNVARGDMSLVGPRPLLMRYLERYSAAEMQRHNVKPGLTGWAQINGRNAVSWEEKFKYDLWYVDHVSFLLDLRILIRTAVKVSLREGVSAGDHATMPEFLGHESELSALESSPGRR